jgi:vacuolar-type H+-ATPase subunit F/Vma7
VNEIGVIVPHAEMARMERIIEAARRLAFDPDLGLITVRDRLLKDLREALERK